MKKDQSFLRTFVFVALLSAMFLASCASNGSSASTQTLSNDSIGVVSTVNVTDTIETSGNLDALQLTTLAWQTSGVVAQVNVKVGEKVKAGEVLATLRPESVPASVLSAQSDLLSAKQNLDDVMNSTLTTAEAQQAAATAAQAVADAQKKVDSLTFPRASDALIQNTQAKLDLAKLQLARAADAYRLVSRRADGDPIKSQALLNLTNAQLNYNTTLSTLNWYTGQSTPLDADTYQANLAVAQAQLADAQRTLDRLKNGPDAATVAAAQAKVDLAQSSVNTMYIIAPFDGEVLAVKTLPDILINTGDAAVELVDRNTLTVDAQVDETDISRVSIGNPAQITMDALPGLKLTGKVSAIDPIGTTVNGLVKYTVTVAIDPTDQAVLFGATTNVTLMTSNPHTTLAVPLGAVQNDSQGEYVLRVSSDGSPERVAVQSGAIVGDVVAVTGNLKDGDRVEVGYSGNNSQQQPGNFRGPFGIGG